MIMTSPYHQISTNISIRDIAWQVTQNLKSHLHRRMSSISSFSHTDPTLMRRKRICCGRPCMILHYLLLLYPLRVALSVLSWLVLRWGVLYLLSTIFSMLLLGRDAFKSLLAESLWLDNTPVWDLRLLKADGAVSRMISTEFCSLCSLKDFLRASSIKRSQTTNNTCMKRESKCV